MGKRLIQVPVIIGTGSGQFFIEKDIKIAPPSPPVYEIKDIKKWVEVYEFKAIPGKVIFNAYLWKDINYATVEHVHDETVNGPLYHSTTKIPFGGFVEIKPFECEEFSHEDIAELLEAHVEGEVDKLHDKSTICGVHVYDKLLEKTVVRLTFKVVRLQHVPIHEEKEKEKEKEKDKYTYKC